MSEQGMTDEGGFDKKGSPELEEWDLSPVETSFDPELYSRERLEIYKMVSATVIVLGFFVTVYMIARLFV